jgi:hypothetical protein
VKTSHLLLGSIALAYITSGCKLESKPAAEEPLTSQEALQALDEASASSEAANVMSGSIEITTNFTIGGAVEQAASELRDFVTSQLPCAEVTIEGSTLAIEYGAKPGECTYKGLTFSGTHTITVTSNEEAEVHVAHTWDSLSNGRVSVSGTADVTWSFAEKSRHVEHEVTWTRLSDGRTGEDSGDLTQTVLEGGLTEGIQMDGSRAWEGQAGRWDLAIEGVEVRWVDPVPQAGTFRLATPKNKSVSLSFSRVDEDTIEVTIASGDKEFSFDVSRAGVVTE